MHVKSSSVLLWFVFLICGQEPLTQTIREKLHFVFWHQSMRTINVETLNTSMSLNTLHNMPPLKALNVSRSLLAVSDTLQRWRAAASLFAYCVNEHDMYTCQTAVPHHHHRAGTRWTRPCICVCVRWLVAVYMMYTHMCVFFAPSSFGTTALYQQWIYTIITRFFSIFTVTIHRKASCR